MLRVGILFATCVLASTFAAAQEPDLNKGQMKVKIERGLGMKQKDSVVKRRRSALPALHPNRRLSRGGVNRAYEGNCKNRC